MADTPLGKVFVWF